MYKNQKSNYISSNEPGNGVAIAGANSTQRAVTNKTKINFQLQIQEAIAATVRGMSKETRKKQDVSNTSEQADSLNHSISTTDSEEECNIGTSTVGRKQTEVRETKEAVIVSSEVCKVTRENNLNECSSGSGEGMDTDNSENVEQVHNGTMKDLTQDAEQETDRSSNSDCGNGPDSIIDSESLKQVHNGTMEGQDTEQETSDSSISEISEKIDDDSFSITNNHVKDGAADVEMTTEVLNASDENLPTQKALKDCVSDVLQDVVENTNSSHIESNSDNETSNEVKNLDATESAQDSSSEVLGNPVETEKSLVDTELTNSSDIKNNSKNIIDSETDTEVQKTVEENMDSTESVQASNRKVFEKAIENEKSLGETELTSKSDIQNNSANIIETGNEVQKTVEENIDVTESVETSSSEESGNAPENSEKIQNANFELQESHNVSLDDISKTAKNEDEPMEVEQINDAVMNKDDNITANKPNATSQVQEAVETLTNEKFMASSVESEGASVNESKDNDSITDEVTKTLQDIVENIVEGIMRPETTEEESISELCSKTVEQIIIAATTSKQENETDSKVSQENEKAEDQAKTEDLEEVQVVNTTLSIDLTDILEENSNQGENINNSVSANFSQLTTRLNIANLNDANSSLLQKQVEGHSEIKQTSETDAGRISKTKLQDILQQVKVLTSTEYLWFYLKLASKCNKVGTTEGETSGSSASTSEAIEEKAKRILQIQQMVETAVSEESKAAIKDVEEKVKDLSVTEYKWLYSNLPTDFTPQYTNPCGPVFSQSLMWLKTNLEEIPERTVVKQVVYNAYHEFCERNNILPITLQIFGKVVRQTFPKVGQRRLGSRSNARYHYMGLQQCMNLPTPCLPKLNKKLELRSNSNPQMSCNRCCEINGQIYRSYLKKSHRFKEKGAKKSPKRILNDEDESVEDFNDDNDSYRSSELDGKTILVHDPLALLNLPGGDKKSAKPLKSFHRSHEDEQISRSAQLVNRFKTRSLRARSLVARPNIKFKQYRHQSVRNLLSEYKSILLPPQILQTNMSPFVVLKNNEVYKWQAEHVATVIKKLSKMIITKIEGSSNFKVICLCCDDVLEISPSHAKQLNDMKEKVLHASVSQVENSSRKRANNDTFQIVKKLDLIPPKLKIKEEFIVESKASVSKHPSIEHVLQEYQRIVLPEEVFTSDIAPTIVLDSGEVLEWYSEQLNNAKARVASMKREKCSNCFQRRIAIRPNKMPLRHSKAKLMNFCESDSSEYESDNKDNYEPLKFLDEIADGTLLSSIENTGTVPALGLAANLLTTGLATAISSDPTAPTHTPVFSDINDLVNIVPEPSLKRSLSIDLTANDAPIIELKKRKMHCNILTVTPKIDVDEVVAPEQHIEHISVEEIKEEFFVCFFCEETSRNIADFVEHEKTHTQCRTCKRKLKNTEIMRMHLINHCSRNSFKRKPYLRLQRIDSVRSVVEKYPETFHKPVTKRTPNILRRATNPARKRYGASKSKPLQDIEQVLIPMASVSGVVANQARTYTRKPRPSAYVSFTNTDTAAPIQPTTPNNAVVTFETNQEQPQAMYQLQPQQPPMLQLKNTISTNLNKILLLSNNGSQSQPSNVMYQLYLDNSNGQSSPTVCLAAPDNSYSPTITSSGVEMNINPSCSNTELQQPPTYMQIVETPNSGMIQYANPVVTQGNTLVTFTPHQDHSYHQQPMFQIGNNLNKIVFLSNNVPPTQLESVVSTTTEFATPFQTTENESTNTTINAGPSNSDNPPTPGQFRIRVKSLQELS